MCANILASTEMSAGCNVIKVEHYMPEKHYDIVRSYWVARGEGAPSKTELPDTGIVLSTDKEYIGASWLHFTNSTKAFIHYVVSNPNVSKRLAFKALNSGFSVLLDMAKKGGVTSIDIIHEDRLLSRSLERAGFKDNVGNFKLAMRRV